MADGAEEDPVGLDETLDGTSRTVEKARSDVVGVLAPHGLAREVLERARLVVSELATNAIQASPGLPYRVRVAVGPDRIRITVANRAPPTALPPSHEWGPEEVLAERGRGLAIVESLSASVHHEAVGGWLEITAELIIDAPPA